MITKSNRRKISKMIRRSPTPSAKRLVSDAFLEPWFLDLETARAVQRIIPRKYSCRMRWFFDDFGCIRCKGKGSGYGGNGFCVNCRYTVVSCIARSIRKRSKNLNEERPPAVSRSGLRRIEVAERLLGDLAASGL
jgi:hypothetical protein